MAFGIPMVGREPKAHCTLFVCLLVRVQWHNNLCRLFNAKSILIQINRSISNNST